MAKNAKDLAGSIDDLMRQMEADKHKDIPEVGGDYDTIEGWADRLGLSRGKTKDLVKWMGCERRTVRVSRGNSYYTCTAIYSPILAAKASQS